MTALEVIYEIELEKSASRMLKRTVKDWKKRKKMCAMLYLAGKTLGKHEADVDDDLGEVIMEKIDAIHWPAA